MKIIMGSMLAAVLVAAGASQMGLLGDKLAAAFPQDEDKRTALSRCETTPGAFDRFDPGARDECYRRTAASPFAELSHTGAAPNQLDLRAAAARGAAGFVPH